MNTVKLLDCTLRDGGYVNNWDFSAQQIEFTVSNLICAGIDYIEIGYLTSITSDVNGTQFGDMESVSRFLPENKRRSKYVIMADVAQFDASALCRKSAQTADGVRIVFYKRQIEQAYAFCEKIVDMGYDLFLQPMVTIDYSPQEFAMLVSRFQRNYPLYSVSIVDSFGCMTKKDVYGFVKILDDCIPQDISVGFHSHNNMSLAMQNSISLFKYTSKRQFIIDASVGGIGRGAGNLPTELIVNYYNLEHNGNFNIEPILDVISSITEPISRTHKWGYSPYLMVTALLRAHPNFAKFLLDTHDVSVSDFLQYLRLVPDDMLTKCTRSYVEDIYMRFKKAKGDNK